MVNSDSFNKSFTVYTLKRTDSDNPDFQKLVIELDKDLAKKNGEANDFFAQYNKTDLIRHVVLCYQNEHAVGCGAIKEYDPGTMEIKRMFVKPEWRGKGIGRMIIEKKKKQADELGYKKCILETGDQMT